MCPIMYLFSNFLKDLLTMSNFLVVKVVFKMQNNLAQIMEIVIFRYIIACCTDLFDSASTYVHYTCLYKFYKKKYDHAMNLFVFLCLVDIISFVVKSDDNFLHFTGVANLKKELVIIRV